MLHYMGLTKLYYLPCTGYYIHRGFSCLIILISIYRLGRLRINYTAGTRQSQDSNPGLSDAYICFFHDVFCLLSHTIALDIKYILKQVY